MNTDIKSEFQRDVDSTADLIRQQVPGANFVLVIYNQKEFTVLNDTGNKFVGLKALRTAVDLLSKED